MMILDSSLSDNDLVALAALTCANYALTFRGPNGVVGANLGQMHLLLRE